MDKILVKMAKMVVNVIHMVLKILSNTKDNTEALHIK